MSTHAPSPLELHGRRAPWGFAPALALATLTTGAAAVWLVLTVLTVLPKRDPAHAPLWGGVALGMLVFAALGAAALRPGRAQRPLALAGAVFGVAALGLGFGAILRMLAVGRAGGHFEGYVVLLGAILVVHGAIAIAHGLSSAAR